MNRNKICKIICPICNKKLSDNLLEDNYIICNQHYFATINSKGIYSRSNKDLIYIVHHFNNKPYKIHFSNDDDRSESKLELTEFVDDNKCSLIDFHENELVIINNYIWDWDTVPSNKKELDDFVIKLLKLNNLK